MDRLTYITSTAFTDVPLLVGTKLVDAVVLVVKDLNEHPELTAHRSVDYNQAADYYSMEWYHKVWLAVIRPITFEYLNKSVPGSWIIKYYDLPYILNLKPN